MEQEFLEGLAALEGKRVRVRAKLRKSVDVAPDVVDVEGFYYADYLGVVLKPAVSPYPKENPNGQLCLWIQTWCVRQQVYAISLESIEEVDDEVLVEPPIHVTMSGLTSTALAT
jgi:hypothetical protein